MFSRKTIAIIRIKDRIKVERINSWEYCKILSLIIVNSSSSYSYSCICKLKKNEYINYVMI